MLRIIDISEQAVEKYGIDAISRWAFLKARCPNGVVFGGYDDQRKEKLGWGRSKYFSVIRSLIDIGLARKDQWGNYVLTKNRDVKGWCGKKRVFHRCTLVLDSEMDERLVRDIVRLKLVEMKARQVRRGIEAKDSAETKITEEPVLGTPHAGLVKFASEGFFPMNTETLMDVTGLDRRALFSWKARMKDKGFMEQQDRREVIPLDLYPFVHNCKRLLEKECRGKVVMCEGRGWIFVQSSTYKLPSYQCKSPRYNKSTKQHLHL